MTDDNTPGEDQTENPEGDSSQQREHTSPSEIAERNSRKYGDSEDLAEINRKLAEAANEKDLGDEDARYAAEERNAQFRTTPEPDEIEEVEEGGSEADQDASNTPGSRYLAVGAGAILFLIALFGLWLFLASDGDQTIGTVAVSVPVVATDGNKTADSVAVSVPVVATDATDSHTSDDASTAASIECDESAGVEVDSRFRVNCTDAMLDRQERLWVMFPLGWGQVPPFGLKSGFFLGTFSYNPTVELGWETHNGVETILGTPVEAYILDNGNVVFATELSPTPPYQLDVTVNFASWQSDEDPVISGDYSMSFSSDSIKTGDPLVDFGGKPVFDLLAGTPLTGD